MIKYEQVKDTPFTRVETEHGYFLSLGNHKISGMFNTKEEADESIKTKMWDYISMLVIRIIQAQKEEEFIKMVKEQQEATKG